jgi:hypothetical protein
VNREEDKISESIQHENDRFNGQRIAEIGWRGKMEMMGGGDIYWHTFHITASQPTTLPLAAAMLFLVAPWDKPDRLREGNNGVA